MGHWGCELSLVHKPSARGVLPQAVASTGIAIQLEVPARVLQDDHAGFFKAGHPLDCTV